MAGTSLGDINQMTAPEAVTALGGIFEKSPWVAEAILAARPFASAGALHRAMAAAVDAAGDEARLALLRAHPELAGADARRKLMSAESVGEQGAAGLDGLSDRQQDEFDELNGAYRAKFGFPFIVAVRTHTMTSILEAFRARVGHGREEELETALSQVYEIARLRLEALTGEAIAPIATTPVRGALADRTGTGT